METSSSPLVVVPGSSAALVVWQNGPGGLLAVAHDQQLAFYNRHGHQIDKLPLAGTCNCLCWDEEGDLLAAAAEKSSRVVLWEAQSRRPQPIVTGLGEGVTWLGWAPTPGPLAIATAKGNLVLYNHRTARRMPILGKHNKQIVDGAWSKSGLLALASDDRSLSVSTAEGDTLRAVALRAEPSLLRFGRMKTEDKPHGDDTVSVVVGKKTLFLLRVAEGEEPLELAFQPRYGQVAAYEWFGDGYVLLAFSAGFLVAVSTHPREIGHELFQLQPHAAGGLRHLAVTSDAAATAAADGLLKLHSLAAETRRVIPLNGVGRLAWSPDGQLLAAAAASGVSVFVARLPSLAAADASRAALLTSLSEVSVTQPNFQEPLISVRLAVEPTWLAVGPQHVAAGMNNRAWFHRLEPEGAAAEAASGREYVARVAAMRLNADVSVALCDGRLYVHPLESATGGTEAVLPPDETDGRVVAHDLTPEVLVYATDMGVLCFFHLEQGCGVLRHKHSAPIRSLTAEPGASRVAFLDQNHHAFIFSPLTESVMEVEVSSGTVALLWDAWPGEAALLASVDATGVAAHAVVRDSVRGAYAAPAGHTTLPPGGNAAPLWLAGGEVGLRGADGALERLMMAPHTAALSTDDAFEALLALRRFKDAWTAAQTDDQWRLLANAALNDLEFEVAARCFRRLKDAGMVGAVEAAAESEDRAEAAALAALCLGEHQLAEEAFLRSERPAAALEMRSALLEWPRALQLAASLDPKQAPLLAKQYAQQLEFTGEYAEAREQYERAAKGGVECVAGLARTALRCGEVRRGLALLAEAQVDSSALRECAEVLEAGGHLPEAADLFERAQLPERAAELHVRLKNWSRVSQLLEKCAAPRLHAQLARAKEADGRYAEAVAAYKAAADPDNAVRLLLDKLRRPEEAVRLVQETRSPAAAKTVARFLRGAGDAGSALKLLVGSGCVGEAFAVAREAGEVALLGRLLSDESCGASADELRQLAQHLEGEQDTFLAGKLLHLAGDAPRAVHLLLKAAALGRKEALELAVQAAAPDPQLADQVIHFICGDVDGVPKDFGLVFKLYLARGQNEEAGQVALLVAEEEQKAGNYRTAHDTLLAAHQQLRKRGHRPPEALRTRLSLLHSYTLARIHVRHGRHLHAARLLSRVAANISKFPAHVVPILTSAVIECERAGLGASAFGLASTLLRPAHRPHLDAKYKRKIESVVRRGARNPEPPHPAAPCPQCAQPLPNYQLTCPTCKNHLPFCIATGRHIERDDFTVCPHCEFPAIASEFAKLLETESVCPMCGEEVEAACLSTLEDISLHLDANN